MNSFNLSGSVHKRYYDGNYTYELYNHEGKLMIDIRSIHPDITKAKPIQLTVPPTVDYCINLRKCFHNHTSLQDISELIYFDASHVINMEEMFYRCSRLTNVDALASWDTSNVTTMTGIFYGCWSLKDLTALSNWTVKEDCEVLSFYNNAFIVHPMEVLPRKNIINHLGKHGAINQKLNKRFPQWLIARHERSRLRVN